jgi:hypothetical protein
MAREFPLNPGEAVLTRQVPHPVAALALYFFSLAALLWSLAVHFIFSSPYWDEAQPMVGGGPETGMVMAAWILPIVIALILVNLREDNRGTAFLFLFLTGPVLALLLWDTAVLGEDPDSGFYSGFVSSYGILAGLLSLVAVDFYRRSVRYYFTSQRMILSRKFLAHGYLGIPYLELKGLRVSYNWLGGLFEEEAGPVCFFQAWVGEGIVEARAAVEAAGCGL